MANKNPRELTLPHALQWWRLRRIALNCLEQPMHMDTSLSLIHRGALIPRSVSATRSSVRLMMFCLSNVLVGLCTGRLGVESLLMLPLRCLKVDFRSICSFIAPLIASTQVFLSSSLLLVVMWYELLFLNEKVGRRIVWCVVYGVWCVWCVWCVWERYVCTI